MILLDKIVKIYYPSQELVIEQLTCKVIEETLLAVKISYVNPNEQELSQRSLAKSEILRGLEENKDVVTKELKCAQYIENLYNQGFFDEIILEMKRGEGYNSNRLIKAVLWSSHANGVYLSDINDADLDKELENVYDSWQL